MNDIEKQVREFYDSFGWKGESGAKGEDLSFRKFSAPYDIYHKKVNKRTIGYFTGLTGKLLIAGGGDFPEPHVEISDYFSSVTCLDISNEASKLAKRKIGKKAEPIIGSILKIGKPDNYFDAVYCAHVIYHIDKNLQEKAVRELIRVTKPNGKIVIVYSNQNSLPQKLVAIKRKTPLLRRLKRKSHPTTSLEQTERPPLYFYLYPLKWWGSFNMDCEVKLAPWDLMSSQQEKHLLVNDTLATKAYQFCNWLENKYPNLVAKLWQYPIVILKKR